MTFLEVDKVVVFLLRGIESVGSIVFLLAARKAAAFAGGAEGPF